MPTTGIYFTDEVYELIKQDKTIVNKILLEYFINKGKIKKKEK